MGEGSGKHCGIVLICNYLPYLIFTHEKLNACLRFIRGKWLSSRELWMGNMNEKFSGEGGNSYEIVMPIIAGILMRLGPGIELSWKIKAAVENPFNLNPWKIVWLDKVFKTKTNFSML